MSIVQYSNVITVLHCLASCWELAEKVLASCFFVCASGEIELFVIGSVAQEFFEASTTLESLDKKWCSQKKGGMKMQNKLVTIANWVTNCAHCQPLSGCILSDLKGKEMQHIIASLNVLTEDVINRIISFHDCCLYRDKLSD